MARVAICGNQAAALAGRGLDLRCPFRRINLKDLRKICGPDLRRSAIKKNAIGGVIWRRLGRGGIGRDRSRPYMSRHMGPVSEKWK